MRCLFLTPFPPYPPVDGGRIRMFELISRLAKRHEVEILSIGTEREADREAAQALRALGLSVEVVPHGSAALGTARALIGGSSLYAAKFRSKAFAAFLAARLGTSSYDIVQCEFAYTGQFRASAPRSQAAWVLDAHNVEHRLSRSIELLDGGTPGVYRVYARREARARFREESRICASMDAVVTVSETDSAILADAVPNIDTYVVPNGVDVDRVVPGGRQGRHPSGLFIGKLDYRPNVDGVRWFADSILPRIREGLPDFELAVIGSGSTERLRRIADVPGIRLLGPVADVVPHLHHAWIVPVPLRAGSGTRLKILEALAAAKPVVTTSVGAEGIDASPGEHLLIADDPDTFAAEVVRACRDPALRHALGRAGRELVEARYDWDRCVEKLEAVYERAEGRLLRGHGSAR